MVANRTPERAHRLAEQYGAPAIPLSDLAEVAGPVDVLVSCTGAAGFLIDADAVSARRTDDAPARRRRPGPAARRRPVASPTCPASG